MRAPAKTGILMLAGVTACLVASCSGDRRDGNPPRDVTGHSLHDASKAPVAVSPLEAGEKPADHQASKGEAAATRLAKTHVAAKSPVKAAVSTSAAGTAGSMAATPQPSAADQTLAAPAAARTDTNAPAPTENPVAPPSERGGAGDEEIGDDPGRAHVSGGVIIIRGGPGSGMDPCELDHPTAPGHPNGGVLINTRVPNMGGPLSTPVGSTGTAPRTPGYGGGGVMRGGGSGGTMRGGGGMGGGRIHH